MKLVKRFQIEVEAEGENDAELLAEVRRFVEMAKREGLRVVGFGERERRESRERAARRGARR